MTGGPVYTGARLDVVEVAKPDEVVLRRVVVGTVVDEDLTVVVAADDDARVVVLATLDGALVVDELLGTALVAADELDVT